MVTLKLSAVDFWTTKQQTKKKKKTYSIITGVICGALLAIDVIARWLLSPF